MRPEELLGDGAIRDIAQVFQEGSLLEVCIHAIAEAVMALANEFILLHDEGVLNLATASLEAREGH